MNVEQTYMDKLNTLLHERILELCTEELKAHSDYMRDKNLLEENLSLKVKITELEKMGKINAAHNAIHSVESNEGRAYFIATMSEAMKRSGFIPEQVDKLCSMACETIMEDKIPTDYRDELQETNRNMSLKINELERVLKGLYLEEEDYCIRNHMHGALDNHFMVQARQLLNLDINKGENS